MSRAAPDAPKIADSPQAESAARQAQAADPSASVWVTAAAGSGKTKVLTDRALRLLLADVPPQQILCLTFTRAAAAEMQGRIRKRLADWAVMPEAELRLELQALTGLPPEPERCQRARRLFANVLDCPGGLRVETLHAFSQSLLRRFPLEAGVPSHFTPLEESETRRLAAHTLQRLLRNAQAAPQSELAAALRLLLERQGEDGLNAIAAAITANRAALERFFAMGPDAWWPQELAQTLGLPQDQPQAPLFPDALRDTALPLAALRALIQCDPGKKYQPGFDAIAQLLAAAEHDRPARWPTYRLAFLTKEHAPRSKLYPSKTPLTAAQQESILHEQERVLALHQHETAQRQFQSCLAFCVIARAWLAEFGQQKRRRLALDYEDLIQQADALLQQDGMGSWVLYKLDGGMTHILLDEAQDTSPAQWNILRALTADFFAGDSAYADRNPDAPPRTLFVVGDEKQSIYSFQGADPVAFAESQQHFAACIPQARQQYRSITLNASFRSAPAVLNVVDAVFADPALHAAIHAHTGAPPLQHHPVRRGQAGSVTLWEKILTTRTPLEPWRLPITPHPQHSAAHALAQKIAATLAQWLAAEKPLESAGRPLRPHDVLILLQRRGAFFVQLVKALKERGVPVSGLDRLSVRDHLAVQDVLAVAEWVLLPEDDLTLATLLRSPLVGLSEDGLFTLAHGRAGSLWASLQQLGAHDQLFAPIAAWLRDRLAQADVISPLAFLAQLLDTPCPADDLSGRRALVRRLGRDALDPLHELLTLARQYEARETPSLQNFLGWLEDTNPEVKRELDSGQDQVRIMTVHGAKGLEAPVVILPDTLYRAKEAPHLLFTSSGLPLYSTGKDERAPAFTALLTAHRAQRQAEQARLLYVALTRARDHLIIAAYANAKDKITPDDPEENPEKALAGLPLWFDAITAGMQRVGAQKTADGLHYALPQTAPPETRKPNENNLDMAPPPEWLFRSAPGETVPPRLTPSRAGTGPARGEPAHGEDARQRGITLHRILQFLPDIAPAQRPAFLKERLQDFPDSSEIAARFMEILEHPQLAPLFGPGSRAEVPLTAQLDAGILTGQIDRLVATSSDILFLDYKTGATPTTLPESVQRQMELYRAALSRIWPGRSVRGFVVYTEQAHIFPLPEEG